MLATFDDAIEGAAFLQENKVDALFLDINMPDLTGLELASQLVEPPMVIFTTAHKKFALEGFELNALDYLLKPIDLERFRRTVQKIKEYHQFRNPDSEAKPTSLYVRSEYRLVRVALGDIVYIEGLSDYIKIHLKSSPHPLLTLMTLKGILDELPESVFRRIHRSYIVAIDQVQSIQNRKVQMSNGIELPISQSYGDFVEVWGKS
ncbi:DNA-binding response regulator [Persicitalea jodogahamensis]|uniref:DNA-binding response regulator n=1 Tax=Persicitalea jodogahamensis TaxID=402147 RepID=A0A8J3D2M4_9BACT|nr:DNA-binding response regulator [Persicitalea jodogahamensis]